jgi:thiamine kinase-like enzyme
MDVPGLPGGTFVHFDARSDNILIRAGRRVVVVEWPWACRADVSRERPLRPPESVTPQR